MSSRRIAQLGLGAALAILALSVGVLMAGAADSSQQSNSQLPVSAASVDAKPIPFSAMAAQPAPQNLGIDKH